MKIHFTSIYIIYLQLSLQNNWNFTWQLTILLYYLLWRKQYDRFFKSRKSAILFLWHCYSDVVHPFIHSMVQYPLPTIAPWPSSLRSLHWMHITCPSNLESDCIRSEHAMHSSQRARTRNHPDIFFKTGLPPAGRVSMVATGKQCIVHFCESC